MENFGWRKLINIDKILYLVWRKISNFYELEKLGIKYPWIDDIPEKYLTDEWYVG